MGRGLTIGFGGQPYTLQCAPGAFNHLGYDAALPNSGAVKDFGLTCLPGAFVHTGGTAQTTIGGTFPAATPTFSPIGATFENAVRVTMSCASSGTASIFYTTDGSTPTSASTPYVGPINVPASATLQAIAIVPGFGQSAVGTTSYTIALNTPTGAIALGYTQNQFNFAPQVSDIAITQAQWQAGTFKLANKYYGTSGPGWTDPTAVTMAQGVMSINLVPTSGIPGQGGAIYTQMPVTPTGGGGGAAGALGYLVAAQGFYAEFHQAITDGVSSDPFEALWLQPQEHSNGNLSYLEIDVQEGNYSFNGGIFSTVVAWLSSGGLKDLYHIFNTPALDRSQFHRYGISYDPKGQMIRFWCDDVNTYSLSTNQTSPTSGVYLDNAIKNYHYYMIADPQTHSGTTNVPYSMMLSNMQAWIPGGSTGQNAIKWNPGDYAAGTQYDAVQGPQYPTDIASIVANNTGVTGYMLGVAGTHIIQAPAYDVAANSITAAQNATGAYAGNADIGAAFNALQSADPGAHMCIALFWNRQWFRNAPTSTLSNGIPMPGFILNAPGGVVRLPTNFGDPDSGATTWTSYTMSPQTHAFGGGCGQYGWGLSGWNFVTGAGAQYAEITPAWWDPAVCQSIRLAVQALHKYILPSGSPYAGQTLDQCKLIEFVGFPADEVSYDFGSNAGDPYNPMGSGANAASVANFRAQFVQTAQSAAAAAPHTLMPVCLSWGASFPGGDTDGPNAFGTFYFPALSAIPNIAITTADSVATAWVAGQGNGKLQSSYGQQSFIGIPNPSTTFTTLPAQTGTNYNGKVVYMAQVQPTDYAALESGVQHHASLIPNAMTGGTAALVGAICSAFGNNAAAKINASHRLWWQFDTQFVESAFQSYIRQGFVSGAPVLAARPTNVQAGAGPAAPTGLQVLFQGMSAAGQGTSGGAPVPTNANTQAIGWVQAVAGANPITQNKIYRSTNGGAFALLATIAAATSYTDAAATGCVGATATPHNAQGQNWAANGYLYQVSAVDSLGVEGPKSATQIFVLYKNGMVLGKPGNGIVSTVNNGVTSNWADTTGAPPFGDTQSSLHTVTSAFGDLLANIGNNATQWNLWCGQGSPAQVFAFLNLSIKPSVANQTFNAWIEYRTDTNSDPGGSQPGVTGLGNSAALYGPQMATGVWGTYKIPLSKLMVSTVADGSIVEGMFYKLGLADQTGLAANHYWVDNMYLSAT